MQTSVTQCPKELLYTSSHEWIKKEGNDTIIVGITAHAADQLGDIVFVDLPETNSAFEKGQDAAVVESVKTAADIYAPLSGTVVEVNDSLSGTPETVNTEPYTTGWLFKIKINDPTQLDQLLTSQAYQNQIESE